MANTKVTSHVIANNAITASMIQSAAVTDAKLHSTLDLSGKTLTLPATAIPSASTATTQAASDNSTKIATTAYVTTAIGNLVDSAPGALNTLNELAAALGDDASFSSTVTTQLATKAPINNPTFTGSISHASDLTLDVGGDISLDADGGEFKFLDGGVESLVIGKTSGSPYIYPTTQDSDLIILGNDGGSQITALTLDMSEAGFATFNSGGSFGGTGALKIPAGTTGQRPSAATGQIRWNTTDGALEVYNGSAWTAVGTGTSNKVLDTFTGNGSNSTFTLSVTPANEDAIMVFIDGAYQEKADYTLTNNSLVLDSPPALNEKIAVHTTTAAVHDGTSAVNNQFTASGSATFTLTQDPGSENNTQVYINGVYQQKTDYTVTGNSLVFDTAPATGDIVEVNMFTVATLGNTDTVTEGVSNQYFTDARARGAISVSGNAISYNSSTGVLTANFEEGPTFTSNAIVNGTLGVGTSVLNSWAAFDGRIRAGARGLYATTSASTQMGYNWYYDGAYKYIGADFANRYYQNGGNHIWESAASGSADGTITWSEKMRIASDGKVGIGTTSAPAGLPLQTKVSSGDNKLRMTTANKDAYILELKDASGDVHLGTNTTAGALVISDNGDVGIGTADPKRQLHIHNSASTSTKIQITNGATGSSSDGDGLQLAIGNDATAYLEQRENADLVFTTNNQEAMRINSSRNVGFHGQTNPNTPIHVGVGTSTGPRIQITHEDSGGFGALDIDAYGSATLRVLSNFSGSAINGLPNTSFGLLTPHAYDIHLGTSGASRMRVKANGKVAVGNVDPYAQFTVYRSGSDPYTPTSFLDQPTMELKGDNVSGGYVGTRLTNLAGNYEWFAGVEQDGSNHADFVFQGYNRSGTTYQEMARLHDAGVWNVPKQPHWHGSITNTTGSGIANSATAQYSRNTINYVTQSGTLRFVAPIGGIYLITFTSISDNGTGRLDSSIYVNGSTVSSQLSSNNGSGYRQRTAAMTLNLSKDDQITVYHADWYASTGTGYEIWRTFSMTMIA